MSPISGYSKSHEPPNGLGRPPQERTQYCTDMPCSTLQCTTTKGPIHMYILYIYIYRLYLGFLKVGVLRGIKISICKYIYIYVYIYIHYRAPCKIIKYVLTNHMTIWEPISIYIYIWPHRKGL